MDLGQPLDDAIGMLYILVIVLGLWTAWPPYPMAAALAATAFVTIDVAIGWMPDAASSVFVNRPLMVLVFTSTAVLVTRFKRLEQQGIANVQQLEDLKRALDAAAIVATTDVTGRITYVNDKFCEISQVQPRRAARAGSPHHQFGAASQGVHPRSVAHDRQRARLARRDPQSRQGWHITTGSTRRSCRSSTRRGKPYQYIAIRADITARKEAEERLRSRRRWRASVSSRRSSRTRSKNPLAGIKGAVQVLMSRRRADDLELPVMRDIVGRIDALNELIGDLLVFARPRAPRLARLELRPLLDEAVSTLRRDPIGATLAIEVEGPNLVVDADVDLIRAAVLNLLINAAQALDGNGRITVAVSQQGQASTVEIRDTGPGIPTDLREQVFEPFVTTKARGGGLGLPIARRTAELHGGSLKLVSRPGEGTVMRLTLPLRRDAPTASGAAPSAIRPHVERADMAQD